MEPGNLGGHEKQSRDYLNKKPLFLKCSNNKIKQHPKPSTTCALHSPSVLILRQHALLGCKIYLLASPLCLLK